jgi:hypothetical protein
MATQDMNKFAEICRRISLNLPPNCRWHWDERFNLALVVFEQEDYELVYLPILMEFDQRWDCFSLTGASAAVKDHADQVFGLIPGQEMFTAAGGNGDGLCLFATLWPWGDDNSYSLRVGMIAPKMSREAIRASLSDWLRIGG